MIDIHSHILPGLDDGAQDWEESLTMASQAVADGITKMIVTPHHKNHRYETSPEQISGLAEELQQRLDQLGIPLELGVGQEIRLYNELIDDLEQGRALGLHGSRYVLIEFPSDRIPDEAEELCHELQIRGAVAILAHPERNAAIVRQPYALESLIEAGFHTQITSHSVAGLFGKSTQRTAFLLCEKGWVHLLASDCHRASVRSPLLADSVQILSERFGKEYAGGLLNNAHAIWRNLEMDSVKPRKLTKNWRRFITFGLSNK